jgi:large subunit ribosomal protein L18
MGKLIQRQKIRYRIRKKVQGTAVKPRLSVFRSNAEIYAQLIDDDNSVTLASASSRDKDIAAQKITKIEKSKLVGAAVARKRLWPRAIACGRRWAARRRSIRPAAVITGETSLRSCSTEAGWGEGT